MNSWYENVRYSIFHHIQSYIKMDHMELKSFPGFNAKSLKLKTESAFSFKFLRPLTILSFQNSQRPTYYLFYLYVECFRIDLDFFMYPHLYISVYENEIFHFIAIV